MKLDEAVAAKAAQVHPQTGAHHTELTRCDFVSHLRVSRLTRIILHQKHFETVQRSTNKLELFSAA
jgi:hypothetical protein